MKSSRKDSCLGFAGFTLIELLCVISIIAILAALLLPVLSRTGARARQVQCINQLEQMGIAFQAFAHDHNSRFPMSVPAADGGSMDFAQNSYRLTGEFYFSYRNFQAISNDLVTPKPLTCPTDSRTPALNFSSLQNSNVSYFLGLNAEYNRPGSILAGDRNVTNDWAGNVSLLHLGPNYFLRWTHELHRFRGNLLFADAHVEERNTPAFVPAHNQSPVVADFALPTPSPANAGPSGNRGNGNSSGTGNGSHGGSSGGFVSGYNSSSPATPAGPGPDAASPSSSQPTQPGSPPPSPPVPPTQPGVPTPPPAAPPSLAKTEPAVASPAASSADEQIAPAVAIPAPAAPVRWWPYVSLLLLLLLLAMAELYRRERAKAKRPWLRDGPMTRR